MRIFLRLSFFLLIFSHSFFVFGDGINSKYLCKQISNHTNAHDKYNFTKQDADELIKVEVFKEKLITNKPQPGTNDKRMILEFERFEENIGNSEYVNGFNFKGAFRTIVFNKKTLTYISQSGLYVWIFHYECILDF